MTLTRNRVTRKGKQFGRFSPATGMIMIVIMSIVPMMRHLCRKLLAKSAPTRLIYQAMPILKISWVILVLCASIADMFVKRNGICRKKLSKAQELWKLQQIHKL
jgi:hypothetical protein